MASEIRLSEYELNVAWIKEYRNYNTIYFIGS
jgi:hypothetical protein